MSVRLMIAVVLAAFAGGCATMSRSAVSGLQPLERADLRMLTWNVGLAPGIVPYVNQREELVAETLQADDADLICLQEVWQDESRQRLLQALEPGYQSYWFDTSGENESGSDSCEPKDLRWMLRCQERRCRDFAAEDKAVCAAKRCFFSGLMLYLHAPRCFNCLVAALGESPEKMAQRCVEGAASRSYGGRNGVVLASRYPMTNLEAVRLPSSGANRVALLATVEVPGRGPVEVACVHFSSDQPTPPTEVRFPNWRSEIGAQLRLTSRRLAKRAGGDRPQLLLGDLNFGGAGWPGIWTEMPIVERLSRRLDFVSVARKARVPFCSWCRSNSLTGAKHDRLIDQLLLRSGGCPVPKLVAAWRIGLVDRLVVSGGRSVRTHPSDHYGVKYDLRWP